MERVGAAEPSARDITMHKPVDAGTNTASRSKMSHPQVVQALSRVLEGAALRTPDPFTDAPTTKCTTVMTPTTHNSRVWRTPG